MRSSLALLALVTGCLEGDVALFGCPPDEVCSDDTPDGLIFFGANLSGTIDLGNPTTAVGGTHLVELKKEVGTSFVPLTAGYVASGGAAVAVETKDLNILTLRGQSPGENYIEIRDSDDLSLMDRKKFSAAEIAAVSVVADKAEGSELPFAFLAGTIRVGVALSSQLDGGLRLVDESMTIELSGADQIKWDLIQLADAQPGTLSAVVTAGGKPPVTLDIVVVSQVDELVDHRFEDGPLVAGQGGFACFEAIAGGTHHVANLDWAISGDGNGEVTALFEMGDHCVSIVPETAGEVTITASAAGLTKVVTYPVAEPMAKPSKPRAPTARSSGVRGDRATAAASR